MTAPVVFDRLLVRRRLQRALVASGEDFLGARVSDDLLDRLLPVQRTFTSILDVGTPSSLLALGLKSRFSEASVTRLATTPAGLDPAASRQVMADVEFNPFRPDAFDLAVSGLALHTVNDLPGALAQIRLSLKPDGLFLGALLGGQTLQELRQTLAATELELTGGASPRVAPFADLRDLGHLLQRAGFALPVTDIDRVTVRYDNLFALMRDLRAFGATNALADRSRRPVTRSFFMRAAEAYQQRYADADGRIRATFDIVWLSGWAPHVSQQKPLKPGSAKMRLADALGVKERKLGDDQPP